MAVTNNPLNSYLSANLTLEEKKFLKVVVSGRGVKLTEAEKEKLYNLKSGGTGEITSQDFMDTFNKGVPQQPEPDGVIKENVRALFPSTVGTEQIPKKTPHLEMKPPTEVKGLPILEASKDKPNLELKPPEETTSLPVLEASTVDDPNRTYGEGSTALKVLADVAGISERFLGATFNRDEGRTFLEEMSDPQSSITKAAQKAVAEGDDAMAIKMLKLIGLGFVSDPVNILSGIFAVAKGSKTVLKASIKAGSKAGKRQIISKTAEEGIELSGEIVGEIKRIMPQGKIPTKIKGVDFTPGEQQVLTGGMDTDILRSEGRFRNSTPQALERFEKSKTSLMKGKFDEAMRVTGVSSLFEATATLPRKLGVNFRKSFDKFTEKAGKEFDKIEALSNKVTFSKKNIDEVVRRVKSFESRPGFKLLKDPPNLKTLDQLTQDEILKIVRNQHHNNKLFDPETLLPATEDQIKAFTNKATMTIDDLSLAGVSRPVVNKYEAFIRILDNPKDLSYSGIKNVRGEIRNLKNSLIAKSTNAPRDIYTLDYLEKSYTDLMRGHMKEIGGGELLNKFEKVNKAYIKKDAYTLIQKEFYNTSGELKDAEDILKNLTTSTDAGNKIAKLKGLIPEPAFEELNKAYFNKIISESSSNGVIQPASLLKTVESRQKDISTWTSLMTKEMQDKMADLVTHAYILEKLKKLPTPLARENKLRSLIIEGKGTSNIIRWAFWRMGIVAGAGLKGASILISKVLQSSESKLAAEFFEGVDAFKFSKAFSASTQKATSLVPKLAGKVIKPRAATPPIEAAKLFNDLPQEPPPGVNPLTP